MKSACIIVLLFLQCVPLFAQDDSTYHVQIILGGGYGVRLGELDAQTNEVEIATTSPAATLRLMWKPEHLVSVGIATGYIPVTQATTKGPIKPNEADGNAQLTAIPALLLFAMEKYNLEVAAGIGIYSLQLHGKSTKNVFIDNSAIEMGYMLSAAYSIPINQFAVGFEIQYLAFTDRDIQMLIPNIRLRWNMFSY